MPSYIFKFLLHYTIVESVIYLICGNKMPVRCNRWFLSQILLLAQHVSGTIMPIIRSSRVLYRWFFFFFLGPVCISSGSTAAFKAYCAIQMVAACGIWCFGFQAAASARKPNTQPSAPHHTDNLKTKAPNTTGSNHLYSTLELLMMGIMVPETCWASNKICNKNHLLHLIGILFPHINDDTWSKSLQM
jgi:hypothetical protein